MVKSARTLLGLMAIIFAPLRLLGRVAVAELKYS
jgi:hypothetical protein